MKLEPSVQDTDTPYANLVNTLKYITKEWYNWLPRARTFYVLSVVTRCVHLPRGFPVPKPGGEGSGFRVHTPLSLQDSVQRAGSVHLAERLCSFPPLNP
jgi:hypothetical protein